MNLYDIIAHGDRIAVFADEETKLIYTWNRSQTLQCWLWLPNIYEWEEIDVRTLSDVPEDIDVVIEKVRVMHQERTNNNGSSA